MERRRSEWRLADLTIATLPEVYLAPGWSVRPVVPADRAVAAEVLLDGYRGTVDDEGEDAADAVAAVDAYFERILWQHSVVVTIESALVSLAFVLVCEGRHFVDPVVTATACKRRGIGTAAVSECLRSLAASGVSEVGATITDGNTGSERLFGGLGFRRVGPWH